MYSKLQINRLLVTKIKALEIQKKSQNQAQPLTQTPPVRHIRAKSTKRARKRSTRKIDVLQSEQPTPSLDVPYAREIGVRRLLFVKESNTVFDQGTCYTEAIKPNVCKKCSTRHLAWLKVDYDMEKNETLEVQACLNSKCKNIESKTRITKTYYDPPSDSDEVTDEEERPKIRNLREAKAYAKTLIASIPKTNRISEIKADTRATQILSTIPDEPNNPRLGTFFPSGIPVMPNGIYWNIHY